MRAYTIIISLLISVLLSCKTYYAANEISIQNNLIDSTLTEQSDIAKTIRPYKSILDKTMNTIICTSNTNLTKTKPESTLGNLLADALYIEAQNYFDSKIDLAIINYGGIRIPSLPKGPITLGKIYELMPFDNYVVLLSIKGKVLKEVCDIIATKGGWPVSGISFTIINSKAEDIFVQNNVLDLEKTYHLAISDYLAGGGDNMALLKTLESRNSSVLLRDAFINYFKQLDQNDQMLDAKLEKRIFVK